MEPTTVEEQLQQWQQQQFFVESPVSVFPTALPGCYWTWQQLPYWRTLLPGEWEQGVARQLLRDQYLRTLSAQQLQTVAAQQQREQQTATVAAGRAKSKQNVALSTPIPPSLMYSNMHRESVQADACKASRETPKRANRAAGKGAGKSNRRRRRCRS